MIPILRIESLMFTFNGRVRCSVQSQRRYRLNPTPLRVYTHISCAAYKSKLEEVSSMFGCGHITTLWHSDPGFLFLVLDSFRMSPSKAFGSTVTSASPLFPSHLCLDIFLPRSSVSRSVHVRDLILSTSLQVEPCKRQSAERSFCQQL